MLLLIFFMLPGAIFSMTFGLSVPPSASALVGSLRGVGYSLETALADLVDNSIAADASIIDIDWDWHGGTPLATVADDGKGMTETQLVEAMRFGGVGPDQQREMHDLGRFGLGLKTASLSQARRMIVASKVAGAISAFGWDVDHMQAHGDAWTLLNMSGSLPDSVMQALDARVSGTVVCWEKIDFGRLEDRPSYEAFLADLGRVEDHLGMIFHRFLSGDARRIGIRLNGNAIAAWDPFLESHEATIPLPVQRLTSPGGQAVVRGFVLPHRDRFRSESEFELAGGPAGWTAQQGFYIYRQKRLLSAGGWLGLGGTRAWTREEPSRLARIQVDIPNSSDRDWRIDIRKAQARPPDAVRGRLQGLAEDVRRKAREVFVYRGYHGPRDKASSVEVDRIWNINPKTARRRYTINRKHELVAFLRSRLATADKGLLDGVLDLIERTVPVDRVWLDVSESGIRPTNSADEKLFEAAFSMTRLLEGTGIPFSQAAERVSRIDPYDRIEDFVTRARKAAGK